MRKLDDFNYVIVDSDGVLRAFHSEVAKTPFVSVQDLDSPKRQYAYITWKLSADGQQLDVRVVNNEVIPKETKDSATVQKLIEKNLQNAELFSGDVQFTRVKE